jgi:hypothetical protein
MHVDPALPAHSLPPRRRFLQTAALTAGAAAIGGVVALPSRVFAQRGALDPDILNFALNLEYLEAEFYSYATSGMGIQGFGIGVDGMGTLGTVTVPATTMVPFTTPAVQQMAMEVAADERAHVQFLRTALGASRVARPAIDFVSSFNAASQAAGLGPTFNAFASEENFLLAGMLFEDVGVTAYKGSARLLTNKDFLEAAAGILAVEGYHASTFRTLLFQRGLSMQANAISNARDSLDGATDLDQGITPDPVSGGAANIVPSDANGLAFSRTPQQVRNIVYLSAAGTPGGFFPAGLNGNIR